MGFLSQSGHLLMRVQSTPGTYAADIATAGVGVRLRSGTLAPNRDLLITDPEIGGNRDITDAYLGAVAFAGDLELYARFEALATLLYAALGAKSSATATGVSTHTITPADTVPWYSIEEKVANGFEVFQYTDAKVNTFHLEADANGFLMATAGVVARLQTAGNTATAEGSMPYDAAPLAVGTNITVTYNGVTLPARSFSFDVNNNLEDDDFRLGSLYLGDVTEKRREVTMGVSIRPADSALWRQAVYGTGAATAPGGLTTKQQAVITINSYEDIVGGTPATKNSLVITVPSAILRPHSVNPSGDDVITEDIEIQAVRPVPATPILTAVVKNSKTDVA
jgi:hypothetical protein